jgi:hypothetical protein
MRYSAPLFQPIGGMLRFLQGTWISWPRVGIILDRNSGYKCPIHAFVALTMCLALTVPRVV